MYYIKEAILNAEIAIKDMARRVLLPTLPDGVVSFVQENLDKSINFDKEKFDRDGYLVIPDFLSSAQVNTLKSHVHQMLHDFSLEGHPMSKFTTGDEDSEHIGDQYFLESGDKIRYFFEEEAIGPDGKLLKPKSQAINKIGHGM